MDMKYPHDALRRRLSTRRLAPLRREVRPWFKLFIPCATVVAASQKFLEPHVQNNEEVATAHLFQFQAGDAVHTLLPANRNDFVCVPSRDRLEWQFDGQVEVSRQKRAATLDDIRAVCFEGIGDIVVVKVEEQPNKLMRQPIDHQLELRVVLHTTPGKKPRPEGTIGSVAKNIKVADQIVGTV